MFLRAGAVSLVLLLASRLLGLARESAQAAAFGTSALADIAVLMLTLPDWITGVLASGALAYVLMPAWAGQPSAQVATMQRRVFYWLLAAAALFSVCLLVVRDQAITLLAGGLPREWLEVASTALIWSALALPLAFIAALWATRLQHERDFLGLYAGHLLVNAGMIAAIAVVGSQAADPKRTVVWLGCGLLAALSLRLTWLALRLRSHGPPEVDGATASLPPLPLWMWAALSAGLPLALPFAARSIASQGGEGALSTFNYAWKLVELPLLLAIQLVATIAFPAIARVHAERLTLSKEQLAAPVRSAFALAWSLACAAAAALMLGAPALTALLFGWGRMDDAALARVSQWGSVAAWGLLPQALIAVSMTVVASQRRLKLPVAVYASALAMLVGAGLLGIHDGLALMKLLNLLFAGVAVVLLAAMGPQVRQWLPWRPMALALGAVCAVGVWTAVVPPPSAGDASYLALAALAAGLVMAAAWLVSNDLRQALRS